MSLSSIAVLRANSAANLSVLLEEARGDSKEPFGKVFTDPLDPEVLCIIVIAGTLDSVSGGAGLDAINVIRANSAENLSAALVAALNDDGMEPYGETFTDPDTGDVCIVVVAGSFTTSVSGGGGGGGVGPTDDIEVNSITSNSATVAGTAVLHDIVTTKIVNDGPYRTDGENTSLAQLAYFAVDVLSADLEEGGSASVYQNAGSSYGITYVPRDVILVGGGTSFDSGGDRDLVLTDGTTVWATVPAATLKALPADSVRGFSPEIVFNGNAINTRATVDTPIVWMWANGTTDYSSGAVATKVLLERVSAPE